MPFVQPSSVYSRSLYKDCGGLNYEEYKIAADLHLFYKMASEPGVKITRIDEVSTHFRKHGDSLGDHNTSKANREKSKMGLHSPKFLSRILNKIS